jgi:hypothetical protein
MSTSQKFILLRKLLSALDLSDVRIEALIDHIQKWLLDDQAEKAEAICYPYHLRDNFLSPAELNFYRVLVTVTADWATIFTKVNLGDLFYASTGEPGQNQAYRNRINRKHVDFLLCDPVTVRPLLGIELDDSSHNRPDRQERDQFVDGVFVAAGLPLAHVAVSRSYPTGKLRSFLRQKAGEQHEAPPIATVGEETAVPNCPKCGAPMLLRTAQRGANAGNQFWGCSHYPRCRGISAIPK